MSAIVPCAPPRTALYCRRQSERILLHRTVQTHLATWLELSCDTRQAGSAPAHVEREFRRYLECGILANGFARARCAECGHDFLIAYSCTPRVLPSGRKRRGACPAGISFGHNTRRMVETATHLGDHVIPRLPIREWVLSPKGIFFRGIGPETVAPFPATRSGRCLHRTPAEISAVDPHLVQHDSEFAGHRYFDSVVFDADALRFLAGKAGAAKIMLGSDMPFPIGDMEPCKVVHAAGFGAAERESILGGNAQRVFRIGPDCWCRT